MHRSLCPFPASPHLLPFPALGSVMPTPAPPTACPLPLSNLVSGPTRSSGILPSSWACVPTMPSVWAPSAFVWEVTSPSVSVSLSSGVRGRLWLPSGFAHTSCCLTVMKLLSVCTPLTGHSESLRA